MWGNRADATAASEGLEAVSDARRSEELAMSNGAVWDALVREALAHPGEERRLGMHHLDAKAAMYYLFNHYGPNTPTWPQVTCRTEPVTDGPYAGRNVRLIVVATATHEAAQVSQP